MNLKELKNEYYSATFTFANLYKNAVMYEKRYKNKTVRIRAIVDYRSDLSLEETLSSLDSEVEITNITVT